MSFVSIVLFPAKCLGFESATLTIWFKHGIKQAGFWTMLIGDPTNDLTYLISCE
ncbi:MAG: hypothetical protein ABI216_07555 [Devosia sp.]